MKKIRCEAVVVRVAEPSGHYPRGIGLKFKAIDRRHEQSFEKFLRSKEFTH